MKYNENITKYENIWELLTDSVEKFGDRDFLHYKKKYAKFHKTYNEFYLEVKKMAAYMDDKGLKKGDKAIIYLPSSPEWLQMMFACSLMGVILVPIDMDTKKEPIKQIISETKPKLIFESNKKRIDVDYKFETILFVEDFYDTIHQYEPVSSREFAKNIEPDDIFEILYTSGTTGKPKGVIITNKTITTNLYNALLVFPIQKEMKALQILPFSHSFALIISMGILATGGDLSFVKNLTSTEIKTALMENEVHIIAAVPLFLSKIKDGIENKFKKAKALPILKLLMNIASLIPSMAIRRAMFFFIHKQLGGNLKMIVSAGSYLQPHIYEWWEKIGVMIIKGYGTTETGPVLSLDRAEDRDAFSIGYPIPNQQLKIVDNEILTKGEHVSPGYFKNEEKTREAFTEDGWYKTGDFAVMEGEKIIYKGRKKNMIALPNGMNVYPEDIENIFNKYSSIVETCVIGVDQTGNGEELFGVFLTDLSQNKLSVLIEEVNKEYLNSNQWIKDFYIWPDEDLPRTHTKKIKKNIVKEKVVRYLSGEKIKKNEKSEPVKKEETQNKDSELLLQILEDVTSIPKDEISMSQNLVRDLSMDSLMRADLLSQIQKEFGKYVKESKINPETSVKDLYKEIKNADEYAGQKNFKGAPTWASSLIPNIIRNTLVQVFWSILLPFYVQIEVKGEIPKDYSKPLLIIANHRANLDGVIISRILPPEIRNVSYISASGFHWDDTWRKYFRPLNQIFVLPIYTVDSRYGLDTMEKTAFYLNNGHNIVVFPEGRLIFNDAKKNKFKKGAAKIIKEFHTDVLEVKIKGLEVVKPHMLLPKPGKHKVTVELVYKEVDPYRAIDEINKELEEDFKGY